jgi:chromosome segregation protein
VKLKRIELQGFKSFVDRTVLKFDEGITGILGPNGCGKSNIVDAVRWVLGAQSAKLLRGESMDDVIFKGTTRRKPVGLAEVTLTFSNEDHRLPIDFEEVAIKRRVTRDGHSEYFINNSLCRLKDIKDLFYDSGAGNTTYSVIELSMINTVLNENTQELRQIIEEGSGITKYKARRRETERKLERTQQDLLRINDLVEEIGREVRSLRYQVGKARRHQRLFEQIRSLDLLIAGRQARGFDERTAEIRDGIQELRTLAEADTGELAELRARIESTRPAVDEREAERRSLEEALLAHEEELKETERQVITIQNRIDEYGRRVAESRQSAASNERRREDLERQILGMEGRLQSLAADLELSGRQIREQEEELELLDSRLAENRRATEQATQLNLEFIEVDAEKQGRLRELRVKRENRQERLGRLAEERSQLENDREAAARRMQELTGTQQRLSGDRMRLLERLAAAERGEADLETGAEDIAARLNALVARREALVSRHELLEKIKREYQGYGQGARNLLQNHAGESRLLGSLADRLQVPDEWTAAFETLFGELLDALVVDGPATAVELVNELRQGEGGTASFLTGPDAGSAAAPLAVPAPGRPAAELVHGDAASVPHLRHLLAQCAVYDTDEDAVAAAAAHRGDVPLVCLARSGLLVTSDGVVRGGRATGGEVSLIGREEKLEKLQAEIEALEERIAAEGRRLDENRARREEQREALIRGRGELNVLDEDIRKVGVELVESRSRRTAAEERLEEIGRERATIDVELEALDAEERDLSHEVAESSRQRFTSTTRLDELRVSVAESEERRDRVRESVEQLRLLHQRKEGERRETEAAREHFRESLAELGAARERLEQEIALGSREQESLGQELAVRREELERGFAERERRRQLVRAAADAIQSLHDETAIWHDRIKEIEDKRSEVRERLHALDNELTSLSLRRENLVERIEEQYKGRFADLIVSWNEEHLPRELERDGEVFQVEQARSLLAEARDKLASLGPVNQLAVEEFDEKSQRLEFLETQKADVEKAKIDLEQAIRRINRTARKLFADTFEEVRRNFIAVFQTLFEGGRADLQLVRTDDPLESNIHILAQPKGKVVDHVQLLSGGERCLTALSLLFAVYLVKPSPFCMLDEVDAPLDDANINRFVRMLRQFSRATQFLVVTHNKLTMETANHLYGVTMMEEGCSTIVSVSFQDVADTQSDAELGDAIAQRRRAIDSREKVKEILADEEETGARFTMAGGEENGEAGGGLGFSFAGEDEGEPDAAAAEGGADRARRKGPEEELEELTATVGQASRKAQAAAQAVFAALGKGKRGEDPQPPAAGDPGTEGQAADAGTGEPAAAGEGGPPSTGGGAGDAPAGARDAGGPEAGEQDPAGDAGKAAGGEDRAEDEPTAPHNKMEATD